ncbi:MAG: hypothetical protein ACOCSL_04480 [Thermoplasmatota archaeon]
MIIKYKELREEEKRRVLTSLKELGKAEIEDLRKALNFEISGKTIGRYLSSSDRAEKVADRVWRYSGVNKN